MTAHRSRIYALTQRLLKYGQTWRRTNATHIVPGFASMYRTSVLPNITINPTGLVIEDFNMTFEVYRKHLGRVGFTVSAKAVTQDPDTVHDYIKQTKRWALGLWQTVRRHRLHLDLLSAMLCVLLLELLTASLAFLVLPVIVVVLAVPDLFPAGASLARGVDGPFRHRESHQPADHLPRRPVARPAADSGRGCCRETATVSPLRPLLRVHADD